MINIPNPCQENFDKMTPTERGAFCEKCSTDTFDFRDLSTTEINQIIIKNKGQHICGRFNQSQLDELNAGFLNWKNQTDKTFQSKFLLACIMVFGLTLFSCNNEETPIIQEMNRIEMVKHTNAEQNFINKDLEIENVDLLDYIDEEIQVPDIIGCEINHLGGDIVVDQEYEEYVEYSNIETHVAGMMAFESSYMNYAEINTPDSSQKESILSQQVLVDPRIFEATAYPNPTQSQSTIALDIDQEGQFEIRMYNLNGQLVQNIHSGILLEGRQQFEVNMNDLNSGMYIVKIISQGQDETLKIQKLN